MLHYYNIYITKTLREGGKLGSCREIERCREGIKKKKKMNKKRERGAESSERREEGKGKKQKKREKKMERAIDIWHSI